MKLRYAIIGLGIAFCISLIVSGLALSSSGRGKSTQTDDMAQVLRVALEHEDVPLYPGADKVEVGKYGRQWRYTSYEVVAPLERVVTFYKEQMPAKDWVLDWENQLDKDHDTMVSYTWDDPGGTLPWSLQVGIWVRTGNPLLFPGISYVSISLYRNPVLSRTPLYSGAKQVEVDTRRTQRDTTYVVSATPSEVKEYYKSTLVQYGWQLMPEDPPGTLVFDWRIGSYERVQAYAWLTITAEPDGGGGTKVRMELSGSTRLDP